VGFLLTVSAGEPRPGAATYLLVFGDPTAWAVLLIVGLIRYGTPSLWLLLLVPIAFCQLAALLFIAILFGGFGH
jgi:hypothetical protein